MSCPCEKSHNTSSPKIGTCNCGSEAQRCCIPHYVVKTKAEARQYTNSIVDVEDDFATYWIDDNGIPVMQNQRPKYENAHTPVEGAYVSKQVIDEASKIVYYYMPDGQVFKVSLEEVA